MAKKRRHAAHRHARHAHHIEHASHKDKNAQAVGIFARYIILILLGIPNLWLFYLIFTPLTAYPVFWLLSLSYDTSLLGTSIILISRSIPIELISACIAGSAYYLLTILNLATPGIKIKKRLALLLGSFGVFLVVNILRIYILSRMAVAGSSFFDITHLLFWYSISTVLVVAIWFAGIKVFKVKDIPFYSDIKFLYKNAGR